MKMTGVRNPGRHVLLDTSNRLRAGSWLQAILHPHQGRRAYDRLVAITNLVADIENLYPRGVSASYAYAGNVYMSVGEWDATLEVMSALMNFDEDVKRRCEHAMCRLGLKIPIFEGRKDKRGSKTQADGPVDHPRRLSTISHDVPPANRRQTLSVAHAPRITPPMEHTTPVEIAPPAQFRRSESEPESESESESESEVTHTLIETVLPAQFRWPEATLAPDAAGPAKEAGSVQETGSVQDREMLVTFDDLVDMIRECAWVELGKVLRQLLGDERQAAYARLDRLIEQWDAALREDARKPVCRVQVSTPPVQTSTPISRKSAVVIDFPGMRRTSSSEDSIFDSALSAEPSFTLPSSSSTPDPKLPRLIAAGWVPAFCGRETEEAPKLARPPMPLGQTKSDVVAALLAEMKDVAVGRSQGLTLNEIMAIRKKQRS
jgi:hypothetical protein